MHGVQGAPAPTQGTKLIQLTKIASTLGPVNHPLRVIPAGSLAKGHIIIMLIFAGIKIIVHWMSQDDVTPLYYKVYRWSKSENFYTAAENCNASSYLPERPC